MKDAMRGRYKNLRSLVTLEKQESHNDINRVTQS